MNARLGCPGLYKKVPQHRSMRLQPCPGQNSLYEASHYSILLIGCVNLFGRLYLFWCSQFYFQICMKSNVWLNW